MRFTVNLRLTPDSAQLLSDGFQGWLDATRNFKDEIMAKMEEVKAAFTEYTAKVDAYIASRTADVDALLAEAIRQDDEGEEIDLHELKQQINAAMARVPPTFEPSNQ